MSNHAATVTCHILIGPPASGKSTLAGRLAQLNPGSVIVSTDLIREKLYGVETVQGNWSVIETEVIRQIQNALAAGRPVIYDATNAHRAWRLDLLQKLGTLADINWIGWHLATPLPQCLTWNRMRFRQVDAMIISKMYQALEDWPPVPAEGFSDVHILSSPAETSDEELLASINKSFKSIINRRNKLSGLHWHQYSKLLDFERLMYLLSLIIENPGFSNWTPDCQDTNSIRLLSETLKVRVGAVYGDPKALETDIEWLTSSSLLNHSQVTSSSVFLRKPQAPLACAHPYSDWPCFHRLMVLIRKIILYPFTQSPGNAALDSLVEAVQLELRAGSLRDQIRKDIERVLKPYRILPGIPMRHGYFAGTGLFTASELMRIFQVMQSLAESKTFIDPLHQEIYETVEMRLRWAGIATDDPYPVRAIEEKSIVAYDQVSPDSLADRQQQERVIHAIESGELLEVVRPAGRASFTNPSEERLLIWPLQVVYHRIAWYLGYEQAGDGLFGFQRLDRLVLGHPQVRTRERQAQAKALAKLKKLLHMSYGIYLGCDAQVQSKLLGSNAKLKRESQITLELRFTDTIFRFIVEGTRRFEYLEMSPPPAHATGLARKKPFTLERDTADSQFPNCLRARLPIWSLEDIDLTRWIVGFGGQVKVVEPTSLAHKVADLGAAIWSLYHESRHSEIQATP